ncbi:Uma2 family endonuclease [Nocardia cyriacigeorgica]|jgi:Uma2 family endonuclease|uniref:Uma2 family endonuclease n=2 Tax=Nocardia cyriacigeorgica TaxID=135487 RepID=UPI00030C9F90|nr:Uma2 family endonuclease [Nocardia cyriacigeorgica]AVH25204.1 Uma2 family endonuclease [Nocardia cyriacigeorgica]PPJ05301.1 Uma2 family endonuclease [Nocardia cyriacigeorgica]TLF54294.1 Uma2 family endonuclease [Nocardia cyriacigeorgica]
MLGPAAGAGRWTAADLDGLPENGLRYEVLNGQLVVSPVPEPRHQVLIQRLLRVLDDAAPTTFVALGGVGILIGDDEPIPDVIVATEPIPWDARGIPVEQVQLAVEVVSASTTLQDRMVKPVLYAAAGIPNYWRFEINSFKGRLPGEELPVLFAHVLGSDNTYEQTHRVPAGEKVTLRSPFDVTIDPAALLP